MPIGPARLTTADGVSLVGDIDAPPDPIAAAVIAHPHPAYGGDRHNPVVATLFARLAAAGLVTLRFDFRGVGSSGGVSGGGTTEGADVTAALDLLEPFGVPLVCVGYSFGADVVLALDDPRVVATVAVAPPLAVIPPGEMRAPRSGRPVLVLSPAHDQFRPPASAQRVVDDQGWATTRVEPVAMADHFLAGLTGVVADATLAFLHDVLAAPPAA